MTDYLSGILIDLGYWAIIFSIGLNVIIAIFGIVPSYFITAANLYVFGFYNGLLISTLGEAIGAVVTFKLYRYGLFSVSQKQFDKQPKIFKIFKAKNNDQKKLIFFTRIVPFVPSGFVTYYGAMGKMSTIQFALYSTLGKIPAMLMEVLVVNTIINSNIQTIIVVIVLVMIIILIKKIYTKG